MGKSGEFPVGETREGAASVVGTREGDGAGAGCKGCKAPDALLPPLPASEGSLPTTIVVSAASMESDQEKACPRAQAVHAHPPVLSHVLSPPPGASEKPSLELKSLR
jgi:hypothetical protein